MIIIWLIGSLIYGQNQYISLDEDISYKEVYEVGGLVYKKNDSSLVNARVVKFNKKTAKKYINVYNGKPSSSGWHSIPKNKSSNSSPDLINVIGSGVALAAGSSPVKVFEELIRIQEEEEEDLSFAYVKQETTNYSGLPPLIKDSNISEGKNAYLNKEQNHIEVIENGTKIDYYSNGAIMNKTNYLNSEKEGLSINYHPNGLLENKVNYTKGKKTGVFEAYYENGQLKALLKYVGVSVKEEVYRNGELISEKKY
jgi:antitoxin component YwqK of YwqJK toxin-antitoxin module